MIRKFAVFAFIFWVPCFLAWAQQETRAERKISVEFVDKDIREALKEISDKAMIGIVFTEEIQVKVNGKFVDVPWPVVLSSVLHAAGGYGYERDSRDERVITIKKKEEILETIVIHVENAPVLDVRRSVEEFLSPSGRVQDDARSNSLIITDQPDSVRKIEQIISQLDKEIPQVLIEALVVEVNLQDGKSVGINWQSLAGYEVGVTPNFYYSNVMNEIDRRLNIDRGDSSREPFVRRALDRPRVANLSFETFDTLAPGAPLASSTQISGRGPQVKDTFFPQNDQNFIFNNQEAETDTKRLYYSAIVDGDTFRAIVSALEQSGNLDVLSNPHIVTTENREAEILVGERFPIADFVFNPETATLEVKGFEYIDIGISLRVTPRVVGGDEILMDIQPEVSQEGAPIVFGGSSGTFIPRIITQEVKTKVVIQNGHTLVIGGLIREAEVNSKTRVPVLGQIPLVGALFRSHGSEKVKRNLMIFITPHVLTRGNVDAVTGEKMAIVRPVKAEPAEPARKQRRKREH